MKPAAKPRGRPKTTGRYETRAELCEMIWRFYQRPGVSGEDVSKIVRASHRVVLDILGSGEGKPAHST